MAKACASIGFAAFSFTGYLVGTLDKWNDAKKAEEKDRVKHSMKKEEKK